MVLKGVNLMQFCHIDDQMVLKEVKYGSTVDGLEMSQFVQCSGFIQNGLERSHFLVLIFCWALDLACHCLL